MLQERQMRRSNGVLRVLVDFLLLTNLCYVISMMPIVSLREGHQNIAAENPKGTGGFLDACAWMHVCMYGPHVNVPIGWRSTSTHF